MDLFLDYTLCVIHGGLVAFNVFGWIWPRTRRIHLVTITLTILSWFVLGLFFGWGYCPLTDWHWDVKVRLGETGLPRSYVKYYLDKSTGFSWSPLVADIVTVAVGLTALAFSCCTNWRDLRARRTLRDGSDEASVGKSR